MTWVWIDLESDPSLFLNSNDTVQDPEAHDAHVGLEQATDTGIQAFSSVMLDNNQNKSDLSERCSSSGALPVIS